MEKMAVRKKNTSKKAWQREHVKFQLAVGSGTKKDFKHSYSLLKVGTLKADTVYKVSIFTTHILSS